MKITKIETLICNARMRNWIFVKVLTDPPGLYGWGEATLEWHTRSVIGAIEDLSQLIIGEDPTRVEHLWQMMFRQHFWHGNGIVRATAIAGIDLALWDIMGKVAGLPVHRLLGGAGRRQILAYASSINWGDDARAEAETRDCLARGFRAIKVKIGQTPRAAIARAELIRKIAGPEIRLSVDANWAFDLDEATQVGEALATLDYWWFEEPIVPEDVEGYRLLRAWLDDRPAGVGLTERFTRLLDEPLIPSSLRAELPI